MSYSQVETTMQTVLAGITGMSTSTVTLGDDSVLDKGVTQAIIIEPGGLTATPTIAGLSEQSQDCRISFYVRYSTKAATHTAFVAFRDLIINELQQYFPDGVKQVSNPYGLWVEGIQADGNPQDIYMSNNPQTGPVFRAQTLIVPVRQTVTIGV